MYSSVRSLASIFLALFRYNSRKREPQQTYWIDTTVLWRSYSTQTGFYLPIENRYYHTARYNPLQSVGNTLPCAACTSDVGRDHSTSSKTRAIYSPSPEVHGSLPSTHCPSLHYTQWATWTWISISTYLFCILSCLSNSLHFSRSTPNPPLHCSRRPTLLLQFFLHYVPQLLQRFFREGACRVKNIIYICFSFHGRLKSTISYRICCTLSPPPFMHRKMHVHNDFEAPNERWFITPDSLRE